MGLKDDMYPKRVSDTASTVKGLLVFREVQNSQKHTLNPRVQHPESTKSR